MLENFYPVKCRFAAISPKAKLFNGVLKFITKILAASLEIFDKLGMAEKLIGEVIHYYSGIKVGIIKLRASLKKGDKLHFKGSTTDFIQVADSMQYNHRDIETAVSGQELGLRVNYKVRDGDQVFLATPDAKIGPVPKIGIVQFIQPKKIAIKKVRKTAKKIAKKPKKPANKKAKKTVKSKKIKKPRKRKK